MRRNQVVEFPLEPGAISDDTDLAAKLRAVLVDKCRVRGKRWQTIGGWSTFLAEGMSSGIARGSHAWALLDGTPVYAAASASTVNVWKDGVRSDITPFWKDVFLQGGPLGQAIILGTNLITVTWTVYLPSDDTFTSEIKHDLQVGDMVTISGYPCVPTGGQYDVNGTFPVAQVLSPYRFTLTASGTAPTRQGVTAPTITVAFRNGLANGTGETVAEQARIPILTNYGEHLLFCFSDGSPLFLWQSGPYPEVMDALPTWIVDDEEGTGWGMSGGASITHGGAPEGTVYVDIAENRTGSVAAYLEGGKVYELSLTISNVGTGATLYTKIDDVVIRGPIISSGVSTASNRTYVSRFVCPANPQQLQFTATGTVRIDTVSIKLYSKATPINEAPQINRHVFVDGNRIINVLGSVEADGDFSAMLHRWCDIDNPREWVPDTDNLAGEINLGVGSKLICGLPVGERNLIFSDDALYAARFTTAGYAHDLIGTGCGVIGPLAASNYANRAFWVTDKGFYIYDGAQPRIVECPVKDRIIDAFAPFQGNKTFTWVNQEFNEVWTHFAHEDDGTEVSRYVLFNFVEEGVWSFGTFDRTTWIRAGIFPYPIAIDVNGAVWSHEIGEDMPGDIILPFVETGYLTAGAGDRWLGCRRYYPDIEEGQIGAINYFITGKRAPQGQLNTQTKGPFLVYPNRRTVDFLISARQIKHRWESEDTPTKWRLGIVGMEVVAERERR